MERRRPASRGGGRVAKRGRRFTKTAMKLTPLILVAAASLLAFPGCEKKTVPEKVDDKIDDALDRRPGEKVRDAAEDVKDGVKDTARDIKRDLKK
jgi:hypothetical protein